METERIDTSAMREDDSVGDGPDPGGFRAQEEVIPAVYRTVEEMPGGGQEEPGQNVVFDEEEFRRYITRNMASWSPPPRIRPNRMNVWKVLKTWWGHGPTPWLSDREWYVIIMLRLMYKRKEM